MLQLHVTLRAVHTCICVTDVGHAHGQSSNVGADVRCDLIYSLIGYSFQGFVVEGNNTVISFMFVS